MTKHACNEQTALLDSAISQMDKEEKTYPVWARLSQVLSFICSSINDALERVEHLESIRSDVRETRTLLRIYLGFEHDPEKALKDYIKDHETDLEIQKYNARNHPSRRASDNKTSFDKVISFFVEKVLPNLLIWLFILLLQFGDQIHLHLNQTP